MKSLRDGMKAASPPGIFDLFRSRKIDGAKRNDPPVY
jgi:hypothetical protein